MIEYLAIILIVMATLILRTCYEIRTTARQIKKQLEMLTAKVNLWDAAFCQEQDAALKSFGLNPDDNPDFVPNTLVWANGVADEDDVNKEEDCDCEECQLESFQEAIAETSGAINDNGVIQVPVNFATITGQIMDTESKYLYTDGYLTNDGCTFPKCGNSATHYLKLCLDFDQSGEPDVTIVVGVGVCLEHLDVPTEQVIMRCQRELMSMGIVGFPKEIVSVKSGKIGDEAWNRFLTAAAIAQGGGRA